MKYGQVYDYQEEVIIDDYSIDIFWEEIEVPFEYNEVYVDVCNEKYSNPNLQRSEVKKFAGGIFKKNNKYGYVDEEANVIIPAIYKGIYDLTITSEVVKNEVGEDYSNYVRICNENGNGIADKQGNVLMECQYGNIVYYGYNTFLVTKETDSGWKMGVVDINDNVIIDFIDGHITQSIFTNTEFAVYSIIKDNHSYEGVIDRNLNIILEPIYNDIFMQSIDRGIYEEYYFVVEKDEKRAVLDIEGNIKIDYCDMSTYELWNEYERRVKNGL